jgi:hypothetical protein
MSMLSQMRTGFSLARGFAKVALVGPFAVHKRTLSAGEIADETASSLGIGFLTLVQRLCKTSIANDAQALQFAHQKLESIVAPQRSGRVSNLVYGKDFSCSPRLTPRELDDLESGRKVLPYILLRFGTSYRDHD